MVTRVGALNMARDTTGWHRKRDTPATRARAAEYASPEHKRIRRQRVAAATEHTPCGYCGRPLGPNPSTWHVPHSEQIGPDGKRLYLPGLWHAQCNWVEAARRGARKRNAMKARTKTTPLKW